jgi:hypothetical protein
VKGDSQDSKIRGAVLKVSYICMQAIYIYCMEVVIPEEHLKHKVDPFVICIL